ncbi:MAG: hypothetical protein IT453_20055 [Planctomycetes bacterium]|nr:hypothetical protein [Planctomycetota bacterium]
MTKTYKPRKKHAAKTTEPKKPAAKAAPKQTTIDDQKGAKPPKPPKASPVVVLAEAQVEERLIESLDHKITGAKEHLKELKALREGAVSRMRTLVREQKQARMFDQSGNATKEAIQTKPADAKTAEPKKPDEAAAKKDSETLKAVEATKAQDAPTATEAA